MDNKNKVDAKKLTVNKINKIFGAIIFVLVFLFTFCWTSKELRDQWVILLSVFGGVILVTGIVWLIMALVIRKKAFNADTNKQKINKILADKKQEEKYTTTDES